MEDYKKKYEQALDNFKKIKAANKDKKELVDFIEYEYPELKESEDEKVRKHLLKHFRTKTKEEWNGMPIKKILAWLEEQDPKKHEEELEKAYKTADEVQYRKGYEDAKREFEKQNEQKSAWSEEDEKIMNQIVSNLEKCTVPGFPIYIGGVELEINWLKSLKERMKGNKV